MNKTDKKPWIWWKHGVIYHIYPRNLRRSLEIAGSVRKLLDQYDDRAGVGEIYTPPPGDAKSAARYWPLFAGRDKARTPMQWTPEQNGGFTKGTPWLPLNRDTPKRNIKAQESEPESLLNHYRNLIKLRKTSEALQRGSWLPVTNGQHGVLAYFRITAEERILVILNFTGRNRKLSLSEHTYGKILFSTHKNPGKFSYLQNMQINPYETTICHICE